jgi:hypothetical protein
MSSDSIRIAALVEPGGILLAAVGRLLYGNFHELVRVI